MAGMSTELKDKDVTIGTLREEIRRGDETHSYFEGKCLFLDAAFEKSMDERAVLLMKAEQEISTLKAKVKDEESVSDRLLQASLAEDDDVDEVFVPACFRNIK
jgi:hypothetical protein